MVFNNKGRIHPAAGPEGHSHSIYNLNDVAAVNSDYQTLISSNGIWVSQVATPYVMVSGTFTYTTAITTGSPVASGSSLLLGNVDFNQAPPTSGYTYTPNFSTGNPFTATPIVNLSLVSLPGGSSGFVPRVTSVSSNGFSLYVINLGSTGAYAAANSLVFHWQAVQMLPSSGAGIVSSDPLKT